MGAIRITSGSATVTLTGDLAEKMAARVQRAGSGIVRTIQQEFEAIATVAEGEWYGPRGVQERTGRSGEINVVTSIDMVKGAATVSVGSAATEIVQLTGTGGSARRGNRPRAVFVHSPGILATTYRHVTPEQYWRTERDMQGYYHRPSSWRDDPGKPAQKFPVIKVHVPGAPLGYGFLLEKLVKAPTRKAIKALIPKIAAAATGG